MRNIDFVKLLSCYLKNMLLCILNCLWKEGGTILVKSFVFNGQSRVSWNIALHPRSDSLENYSIFVIRNLGYLATND